MVEFGSGKRGNDGFSRIGLTLILFFIILLTGYLSYELFFIPDPVIKGMDAFDFLPANKTVTLRGENIKFIEISIYQEGKKIDLLKDEPETSEKIYPIGIKPKDLGLIDGKVIISVNAKAGILKKVQFNIESIIDTVPPTLDVVRATSVISQGSAGFALLRSKGADSVFVQLVAPAKQEPVQQGRVFRASSIGTDVQSEQHGELGTGSEKIMSHSRKRHFKDYYVFFPAPYDIRDGSIYYAVAVDIAGNQNIKALSTGIKTEKHKKSSINIDDSFINKVLAPLLNEISISNSANAFKKVNEEWREKDMKSLINIARNSESKILWEGRFLQLKNSKVMATYGDKRTYFYKGKKIGKSVHLGYDLASLANAQVEAANNGIVRFAGDLGIYGDTVIIDHGLGLMSLYGHLSMIMVKEGQAVKKGEIIAKTGSTGLAGGDHLHFGVLIHGYEVSPLYWWDPNWIRINVTDYLRS
jgi:murein DD-endopeptidase MepM/ murein hydrolase activator NlpD